MHNENLKIGTLVIVKPLPGISLASFYEGQLGVVVKTPRNGDIEYEVYVDEQSLWLIRGELELVA